MNQTTGVAADMPSTPLWIRYQPLGGSQMPHFGASPGGQYRG
jgi:hypothetical protein